MRKIFIGIVVVIMVITLLAYANAELGFRSDSKIPMPAGTSVSMTPKLSNTAYESTSKSSINSSSKGIQLHFQDYPLGEILRNIHDETGIRFNLSSRMATIPITIKVEAKDWKNSVRKLVADFSRVEIWTNRPKTSRIWLIESMSHN